MLEHAALTQRMNRHFHDVKPEKQHTEIEQHFTYTVLPLGSGEDVDQDADKQRNDAVHANIHGNDLTGKCGADVGSEHNAHGVTEAERLGIDEDDGEDDDSRGTIEHHRNERADDDRSENVLCVPVKHFFDPIAEGLFHDH